MTTNEPKTKPKPLIVNVDGVRIRVYKPAGSRVWYAESRKEHGTADGKRRQSLEVTAKDEAKNLAAALARRLAAERKAGTATTAPVTFDELRRLYLANKILKPARRYFMEQTLELFARALEPGGRPFRMDDFGQTQAEVYIEARRTGRLRRANPRAKDNPRAGTLANELQALSTVCNWAMGFKQNGCRLLEHNPVRDVAMLREENPRRPVATVDRLDRLLAVADSIDRSGQFRLLLHMAAGTGRRISAILHLRRSDLLFGKDHVRAGLAAAGWPEGHAEEWPNAVHWRAEHDKRGQAWVSPLPDRLRTELEAYVRRLAVVGDAWLFPGSKVPEKPTPRANTEHWLKRAEVAAGLPHQARGGWHAFRRAWATARKGYPISDVMQAGGWRDAKALQKAYTQADPATVRRVMEG
jgi:integrase